MAEKKKESNKEKPADERYKVIELAISGIAVFTAVVYVLGRLYIEAYYNALGIAPGLLSFSTEDYMFSSVNLVIICAMASLYLYLNYYAALKGVSMFFWLPRYSESKDRPEKAMIEETTAERMLNISLAILGLIYIVMVFVPLYSGWFPYLPGLTGLLIGLALGVSMLLPYGLVVRATGKIKFERPYLIFIIGLLIIVGWLPSISSNLAKTEAIADIQTFPKAVIIYENELIPQLQSSPQSQNESVEVSIITTNNDMTYLLKQDADSDERWQVYRIQNGNIKTIIFAGNSS